MDAVHPPFPDSAFDGILFADVLEHVKHTKVADLLGVSYRLLKSGGHIFINIPNRETWTKKAFDEPSHLWIPTKSDMKAILNIANFKNIQVFTRGFPIISRFRKYFPRDIHFPVGGTSIFISAQK